MGNVIDLTGMKINKWTVIKCVGRNKSGGAVWECICECGNVRNVDGRSLRNGSSKCCGCDKKYWETHRHPWTKHLGRKDRLYGVWSGMKDRCYNHNAPAFIHYGGRGITMDPQWKESYESFRDWAMENGYDKNAKKGSCTIDRIDNDKGYYPDNCRWVSTKIQCNNTRVNHRLTFNGETHTITEWSEITGIRKDTLRRRVSEYGWSVERALTERTHKYKVK